ncbi:MAG: hypothetical protein FDZ69_07415 [Deltaproteobacteria bacterium]|nr:MAG: hypothetical protein FDZ69_07415 [Deltaproteobacteria bacterium]
MNVYQLTADHAAVAAGPYDIESVEVRKITGHSNPECLSAEDLLAYHLAAEEAAPLGPEEKAGAPAIVGGKVILPAVPKTPEELAAEVAAWREAAECTRRQGLMLLEEAGLYDAVMGIVSGLPRLDQIEFQNAGTFKRLHPLLTAVAAQAGITPEQLDAMFREAMLR